MISCRGQARTARTTETFARSTEFHAVTDAGPFQPPLSTVSLSLLYISILIRRCEIIESPYPAWTLSLQTRDSRINLSHSPSAAADKWSRVQQVFMKMKLFRVAEKEGKKSARRESRNSREDVLRMFLTWKSRLSLHFQSLISLMNSPSSLLFSFTVLVLRLLRALLSVASNERGKSPKINIT